MTGKFITLEGGEGAGKSTQAKALAAFLRARGFEVVLTREPGGCPSAEAVRDLWLHKSEHHWDGLTEVLLICAARREHLTKVIWPALERGAWVVCDRFLDSTRAYQGAGLGLGVDVVDHYYRHIAGKIFMPDLTLLLDLPVEEGLRRVAARAGADDRYQQKDTAFHRTLRDCFLDLAGKEPERIELIDGARDVSLIGADICAAVQQRFGVA